MAQQVQVVLTDDISGESADITAQFGFDGIQYEIDLSQENYDALAEFLQPYVENGRRIGGRKVRSDVKGRVPGQTGGSSTTTAKEETQAIREWAREQGMEVADRGRISADIRNAYAAAH